MNGPSVSRRLVQAIGLAALAVSAGCDVGRYCTLLGCVGGLYVQFPAAPTAAYRIEITNSGLGTTHVFECAQPGQCLYPAVFQDYFPRSATIKVITASGSTTTNVTPEYVENFPNGKGCGPACTQATVTVPFPAG